MDDLYNVKKRVLISQLYSIAYAAVFAIVGKGKVAYLLLALFVVLTFIIQSRRTKTPIGTKKVNPDEVLSARRLYTEDKAREYQLRDDMLLREMQEQGRITMYMSIGMIVSFIYIFIVWPKVYDLGSLFQAKLGNEKLALFLAFLTYFEGFTVINTLSQLYALRKVKSITTYVIPSSYVITEKGIVYRGIVGQTAIPFPLPPDVKLSVNNRRGFVELVKAEERSISKIRLYTRNPKRVAFLIEKFGGLHGGGSITEVKE